MFDVIRMYSRDIDNMLWFDRVYINAYRQVASLTIWLARLKPEVQTRIRDICSLCRFFIVEADNIGRGKLDSLRDLVKGLWSPAFEALISLLRYSGVSHHAMAILLQMICEGRPRQFPFERL